MSNITRRYIFVIVILIAAFSVYNYIIYTSEGYTNSISLSPKAIKGQQLWQNNNCWACHQVYGLGGYLGPDLTNIFSNPNKGPNYIKAFLNSGVKSMPVFNFSENEKNAIVAYLQTIDGTGYYPNYDASLEVTGWVKLKYKHEE